MDKKYLPIGSVVMLKEGRKNLMITGFCMIDKNDNDKMYDYCGCLHPEGLLDTEKVALFNHEQIEKVWYLGYKNEEEILFKEKLIKYVNENNIAKEEEKK